MLLAQFILTFQQTQNNMRCFIVQLMTILVLIVMVSVRDVPWEDVFKFSASAAASEFCEWVQIRIDVYIPHRKKYKVQTG